MDAGMTRGLLVNVFPGLERTSIMPEDREVTLMSWREENDIRYGLTHEGEELPILEVRDAHGKVFKLDPSCLAAPDL